MGPQAGQTEKLVKKNRNMVQCIYILMELASRNMILKNFTQLRDMSIFVDLWVIFLFL